MKVVKGHKRLVIADLYTVEELYDYIKEDRGMKTKMPL